jgi:hypothetical protein
MPIDHDNTTPKVTALNQFRTERQDAAAQAPEKERGKKDDSL